MQASSMMLQSAPMARRPIAFSGGKSIRQASPTRPQDPIRPLPHRAVQCASSAAHESGTSDPDQAPSTSCTTSGSTWGHRHHHHVSHQPHAASTSSVDRRTALLLSSSLVSSFLLATGLGAAGPARADEAPSFIQRGLSKYIKKKRLDPLDTYIPLILQAREQLVAAEEAQKTSAAAARDLLRSGAFYGLREQVRAVGEYAVINKVADASAPLVNGFFRAVEDYDLVLAVSVREKKELDVADAAVRLQAAVAALDTLLATVPPLDMERGKRVLEVARERQRAIEAEAAAELAAATAAPATSPELAATAPATEASTESASVEAAL